MHSLHKANKHKIALYKMQLVYTKSQMYKQNDAYIAD